MYLVVVVLLMAVLPAGSIYAEHSLYHSAVPLILLAGKWFVFWSAGVRLFLAGLRQFFQPSFTARQIFHTESDEVLPLVRELGIANFAAGIIGMASLLVPGFILPVAIYSALYYGIAGIRHVAGKDRSLNENIAMITDLYIAIVFAVYVAFAAGLTMEVRDSGAGSDASLAQVSRDWARDWQAKKLDDVLALYTDDAVFLDAGGSEVAGKPALRKFFAGVLAMYSAKPLMHTTASAASGDLGYDSGNYSETLTPVAKPGSAIATHGSYQVILRRVNGHWLIARQIWTGSARVPVKL